METEAWPEAGCWNGPETQKMPRLGNQTDPGPHPDPTTEFYVITDHSLPLWASGVPWCNFLGG